jgi:hypothetical protein
MSPMAVRICFAPCRPARRNQAIGVMILLHRWRNRAATPCRHVTAALSPFLPDMWRALKHMERV